MKSFEGSLLERSTAPRRSSSSAGAALASSIEKRSLTLGCSKPQRWASTFEARWFVFETQKSWSSSSSEDQLTSFESRFYLKVFACSLCLAVSRGGRRLFWRSCSRCGKRSCRLIVCWWIFRWQSPLTSRLIRCNFAVPHFFRYLNSHFDGYFLLICFGSFFGSCRSSSIHSYLQSGSKGLR